MVRGGIRLLLGLGLVLHGLASAVFPLRGIDAVEPGRWAAFPAVLYVVAIIGFVAAGLGVLGVRPLAGISRRTAAAAGVAAIIAFGWLGDGDLWVGIALSALLPILTNVWVRLEPETTDVRGILRLPLDAIGLAFLAWVIASTMLWPWHRAWGTAPQEWTMSLPGDRQPRTPTFEILHAVTVDAPPSAVWMWLVQLGQDRAGFYSYERLERMFGVDIHNVEALRSEWQTRKAGDFVPATQAGYMGGIFGDRPGWTVDLAEPNRALVLRYWGAFVLLPEGDTQTRFLIRSTISNERIPAWAAGLNLVAFELPHFIMQRRMMLTIKELAERSVLARASLSGVHP